MTQPLRLFAFFVVLLDLGLAGHGRAEERPRGNHGRELSRGVFVDSWMGQRLCDLNTAEEAELVALPGIGPARAKAIIAYRKAHPFRSVSDLIRIKGIGRKTLGKLRPLITVSLASAANGAKPAQTGATEKTADPDERERVAQKRPTSPIQGGNSSAGRLK